MYVIDRMYDPDGDVPAHAIKGAFAVDGQGEIGEYQANPDYQPSLVEQGIPWANWLDRGMRRTMAGQIDQHMFLRIIAKAVLPVVVTPEGHLMLLQTSGGPRLTAHLASSLVPEGVHAKLMYLPRLLRMLPPEASLVVNGSAGLQAQFPVSDLVAALREMNLLVDSPSGGLDVGPTFWVQHSARLAEFVDEPTFSVIEQALAQWGYLSEATPKRGRQVEIGITAVGVLVEGGITDPDVLAAAAVFNAVDPVSSGGGRTRVIHPDEEDTRVLAILRSATSPLNPSEKEPDCPEFDGDLLYHVYVEHLRTLPWQPRAVVLANRIADMVTPWTNAEVRDSREGDLAQPLRSCARDLPKAFRMRILESWGVDPLHLAPWKLDPEPRVVITSPAQAIDRARAVVGELADPVHVEDIGRTYLVRSESAPGRVHFVHKVWETVVSDADDGNAIDWYRARFDLFPFEERQPGGPLEPQERFVGAMLAGAIGDCLGFPYETGDIGQIRDREGHLGITEPRRVMQNGAEVSDDTQMMLFTLEGLIRAHVARRMNPVDNDPVPEVQHAYQRWLHTQDQSWAQVGGPFALRLPAPDGWLITNPELFVARAPSTTCQVALAEFAKTNRFATPQRKVNDSKGRGGAVRAAPVAVWSNDPAEVFHAAVGTAALTHGHPSGYLSAGVLAVIVHQLMRDVPLLDSARVARELLTRWPGHEEQLRALDAAVELARNGPVTPEELTDALGHGRTGEEAVAIGLYAVLATDDLREALLLSVNHSGNSPSTGIVCGTIGGALHGTRAIPEAWRGFVELGEIIEQLARDALAEFSPGPPNDEAWLRRYPAW
ncbi:ADP-ribosylglycohydrolase family protein [Saccharopolyspora sp. CA-218241]|uniref:ADP-ribosylglycohydrolase family protein n=1 Tax=Saccharopolyspora sp. CA-218241 TaxID=3240027 RepID=UPI003D959A2D